MAELIRYPFTDHGVRDALRALGTTANAVARNLDAMGFKGCRERSGNCPVANYLLAVVTDARDVSVSCGDASLWNEQSRDRVGATWTEAVELFVELFDAGRFAQLEELEVSRG